MHFSLVKLIPEGNVPVHGLDDVILPVFHALKRLGFMVETRVNAVNPQSINIVFGSCNVPKTDLPPNSIIFNLEQFTDNSPWINSTYLYHLSKFKIWDYSPRNIAFLRDKLGLSDITGIKLGYVPEMTRLSDSLPQDVDVLFYGVVNDRRKVILEKLAVAGVNLKLLQGAYGAARDSWIARSKLIINVHHYIPASLEVPRLGYLWANKKAVVSELGPQTEYDLGLDGACRYCEYEDLADSVYALLADDKARAEQAEAGFKSFSAISMVEGLKPLVGSRVFAPNKFSGRPAHLHVGSGKDFRPEALNIDIAAHCNPDVVLDLSLPLDFAAKHETARFGDVTLRRESFKRITAFELLEHVKDVPQTMRNFLDLLTIGGELELSVPYDLSLGAWQDPTHIHAFNENSWLYYTTWAWYLGWREERFELTRLNFNLSEYGKALKSQGASMEAIVRMPRAVFGMEVALRKRKATEEETEEHDLQFRNYLKTNSFDWTVN